MAGFTKPRDLILACMMCLGLAAIIAPRVAHSQAQTSPSICIDPECNSVQISPHTPFQVYLFIELPRFVNNGRGSFTVPQGKRLIIEHVSAGSALGANSFVSFSFSTTTGGVSATHSLVPTYEGETVRDPADRGASLDVVSQAIRAYADGGTIVTAKISSNASGTGGFTFSGYLVNMS